MTEWQPIETAPRDGTEVLVVTRQLDDERWDYLSRRRFVARHLATSRLDLGWALFPGMVVGDGWLSGWQPLPSPPDQTRTIPR